MSEKSKDTQRSPLSRRTLLGIGASAAVTLLAVSACGNKTGYSHGDGTYSVDCSSGTFPHTAYTFYDQNGVIAGSRSEFDFIFAETNAGGEAFLAAKGNGYTTDKYSETYTAAKDGAKLEDISGKAEIIAGKLTGAGKKRGFEDANTDFTIVCDNDVTKYGSPEAIPTSAFQTVEWQSVQP